MGWVNNSLGYYNNSADNNNSLAIITIVCSGLVLVHSIYLHKFEFKTVRMLTDSCCVASIGMALGVYISKIFRITVLLVFILAWCCSLYCVWFQATSTDLNFQLLLVLICFHMACVVLLWHFATRWSHIHDSNYSQKQGISFGLMSLCIFICCWWLSLQVWFSTLLFLHLWMLHLDVVFFFLYNSYIIAILLDSQFSIYFSHILSLGKFFGSVKVVLSVTQSC